MCGIFGFQLKHEKVLTPGQQMVLSSILATNNDDRGGDSWGFLVSDMKEYIIERGLGKIAPFCDMLMDFPMVMGHTRLATTGSVVQKHSHPFEIGNIIGAHNGMIYNHTELNKTYPDRNFEVDSMHLFAHLDLGLDFSELEGYGAIQWIYKNDPSRIYLSKLLCGELAVFGLGTQKKTTGVVWSSNKNHLIEAIEKAGIDDYFSFKLNEHNVYYIENGDVYMDNARKLKLSAGYMSSPKFLSGWEGHFSAANKDQLEEWDMSNWGPEDWDLWNKYNNDLPDDEETPEKDNQEYYDGLTIVTGDELDNYLVNDSDGIDDFDQKMFSNWKE